MATTPAAPARICVGCLLSVSSCSCTTLNPPAVGGENVPLCRCGRLTSAPHLRSLAELAVATLRQGVKEGDPLTLAIAGVGEPVVVEPSPEPCRCGRELNGWTEPACLGCNRVPESCICEQLEPQPRRVCLDCTFNEGKVSAVVAHVRATNHRIDLALVELASEEVPPPTPARGSFQARLEAAHALAEQEASALAGLAVDRGAFQHGQLFARVLEDALARAKRQRDFLRSLVAVLANPGSRLVLENGRPVVHLPESTVEELGAVELDAEAFQQVEVRATTPPPVPDELEATQIIRAPGSSESEASSAADSRQLGLFNPGHASGEGVSRG